MLNLRKLIPIFLVIILTCGCVAIIIHLEKIPWCMRFKIFTFTLLYSEEYVLLALVISL